ncbi:hypothetical protein V6O07_17635, partial [Arthrospira platensis SPKY2]
MLGAVSGLFIMGLAAILIIGLIDGNGRSERAIRWFARTLHLNEDRWAKVLRELGVRVEELIRDRVLLRKVVLWSLAQWLFDMAALWVFIRAFGATL